MIKVITQLSNTLTPQMYQYLQMLQMNNAELDAHILELYESNPMLELDKDSPSPSMELYYDSFSGHKPSKASSGSDNLRDMMDMAAASVSNKSIYKDLCLQIDLLKLSPRMRKMLMFLVADVDENGYLSNDILDELMDTFPVSKGEANEALTLMQTLDPCGVGARNLNECLQIQLKRLYPYEQLAFALVSEHLEDIAKARYRKIAKQQNTSLENVMRAIEIIRMLDPKPATEYSSDHTVPYIRPDVLISRDDSKFVITLQSNRANRVSISPQYKELLSNATDSELKHYLSEKQTEAQNLMNRLEMRHSTLLSCTTKILEHQQAFFLGLENAPRPYTQALLAEELKLNPSTVSRALSGKYLQCPEGIFPMAYFFPAEVTSESSASSADVSAMISKLVKEENKAAPLSDNDIQAALERNGLYISRRSIANYRNRLNIPPAALRKNNR